jgi:hypothetical protein
MRFMPFAAAASLLCANLIAHAQDEDEFSDITPVDPLVQCLETGQDRFERCSSDPGTQIDCQFEQENYEAQCYELHGH